MERDGGSVLKALSAAEGALPRPRCPGEASTIANKPSERTPTPASASGSASQTRARDKRNLDTENPRRPVANYSTAGVSRTLPAGASSNSEPTSYKPAGRGGTSYASRVGFT